MSKRLFICLVIFTIGMGIITGCIPNFTPYTLQVSVNGEGTVTPSGGQYFMGTTVTIVASPKANWKFDHWSGDASGTQSTITVVMNSNKNIVAHFVPIVPVQYTLQVSTSGKGTVNPTSGQYSGGTNVDITATPDTHWKFDHWSGDASGNQPNLTVTMNSNKNITAHFMPIQYAVNTTVEGQGTVEQTLLAVPQDVYNSGATVQLKAVPANGWTFKEWQGDLSGSTNPEVITVTKAYNVKAVFVQQENMAKWNFIVYLDGDNNLEECAIADINEMEEVGSTDDVNILALVDRHPGYDTSNGNWAGTRLYRITKDASNSANIVSELLHDYGELDMSDPQVLKNFVIDCQEEYPAERTILTLWDHGDGLYPKSFNYTVDPGRKKGTEGPEMTGTRGICWDDTTGTGAWNCLTTDEVANALMQARQTTGKKLEIINMDACLMQTLEVAYEWRNEANYLVGSQETVPGEGNNYETLLTMIKDTPVISTRDFAEGLVDDYYNYYNANGDGKETYSALSLGTEFNTLITNFKAFATAMKQTTDMEAVLQAWGETTWFSFWQYDDLYDFASEMIIQSSDTNVVNKATALKQSIENAVINHKETTDYQGKAFGLSIFLASANEWDDYSEANQYVSFLLSQDSDWDEFVLRFVEYTGSITPGQVLYVEMSWPSGDCDLGIWEPDDVYYWTFDEVSPNGVFSADATAGGTETWTINETHDPGWYSPLVFSYSYSGAVNFKVIYNGETFNTAITVTSGYGYVLYDFQVTAVQGVRQLRYKVDRIQIQMPNK